jgi:hypothetical protein
MRVMRGDISYTRQTQNTTDRELKGAHRPCETIAGCRELRSTAQGQELSAQLKRHPSWAFSGVQICIALGDSWGTSCCKKKSLWDL